MPTEAFIVAVTGVVGGILGGLWLFRTKEHALREQLSVRERELSERASREEQSARDRQRRMDETEARLTERESAVTRQMDRFGELETDLRRRAEHLEQAQRETTEAQTVAQQMGSAFRDRMEALSGMTSAEARNELIRVVEAQSATEAADIERRMVQQAQGRAEAEARRILATAIQRYAGQHTFETTTSTVMLPGDDMKGRIIGRDGRNIRAFEAATGVTVLVDDTPNAVVLSGFDPVRREAARLVMERLVLDGRIHPARIEEVVGAVTREMDDYILKKGEEAVFAAAVSLPAPEVVRLLGRLHFRYSFSQNVLQHSVEVAHLCGLMASELGDDAAMARRAGLMHDIGKAQSHEVEGPHALVGADFLKQHGEGAVIVNAVASHHQEVPHENIFGILVSAADAISASRPGSRSEGMATYLQRLQNLEQIAMDHAGVEKAFAVQAGRELRVIVRPESVSDEEGVRLAREIARRVEDELVYPGQIRVTVIRETRCVEFAK